MVTEGLRLNIEPSRSVSCTIRFDPETVKLLRGVAKQHKTTFSTVVYEIVRAALPRPAPGEGNDRRQGERRSA